MSFFLSNNFKVPFPYFCGDWLADGSQDSEMFHLMFDVLVAGSLQQSQGSWRNIELGHLVLGNNLPVSREIRVGRRSLEDDRGNTEQERSIDYVGVASDPSNITTAKELVRVMDIKDIFSGASSSDEIASSGVHHALGLASRTRGIEQEKWVLRVHWLRGNVGGPLLDLLVPPPITALGPGHISAGALIHQAVRDIWALLQSIVNNLLCPDQLPASLSLIRCDDDLGLSINDTVAKGVGGESCEHDRVDCSNPGAG